MTQEEFFQRLKILRQSMNLADVWMNLPKDTRSDDHAKEWLSLVKSDIDFLIETVK